MRTTRLLTLLTAALLCAQGFGTTAARAAEPPTAQAAIAIRQ